MRSANGLIFPASNAGGIIGKWSQLSKALNLPATTGPTSLRDFFRKEINTGRIIFMQGRWKDSSDDDDDDDDGGGRNGVLEDNDNNERLDEDNNDDNNDDDENSDNNGEDEEPADDIMSNYDNDGEEEEDAYASPDEVTGEENLGEDDTNGIAEQDLVQLEDELTNLKGSPATFHENVDTSSHVIFNTDVDAYNRVIHPNQLHTIVGELIDVYSAFVSQRDYRSRFPILKSVTYELLVVQRQPVYVLIGCTKLTVPLMRMLILKELYKKTPVARFPSCVSSALTHTQFHLSSRVLGLICLEHGIHIHLGTFGGKIPAYLCIGSNPEDGVFDFKLPYSEARGRTITGNQDNVYFFSDCSVVPTSNAPRISLMHKLIDADPNLLATHIKYPFLNKKLYTEMTVRSYPLLAAADSQFGIPKCYALEIRPHKNDPMSFFLEKITIYSGTRHLFVSVFSKQYAEFESCNQLYSFHNQVNKNIYRYQSYLFNPDFGASSYRYEISLKSNHMGKFVLKPNHLSGIIIIFICY